MSLNIENENNNKTIGNEDITEANKTSKNENTQDLNPQTNLSIKNASDEDNVNIQGGKKMKEFLNKNIYVNNTNKNAANISKQQINKKQKKKSDFVGAKTTFIKNKKYLDANSFMQNIENKKGILGDTNLNISIDGYKRKQNDLMDLSSDNKKTKDILETKEELEFELENLTIKNDKQNLTNLENSKLNKIEELAATTNFDANDACFNSERNKAEDERDKNRETCKGILRYKNEQKGKLNKENKILPNNDDFKTSNLHKESFKSINNNKNEQLSKDYNKEIKNTSFEGTGDKSNLKLKAGLTKESKEKAKQFKNIFNNEPNKIKPIQDSKNKIKQNTEKDKIKPVLEAKQEIKENTRILNNEKDKHKSILEVKLEIKQNKSLQNVEKDISDSSHEINEEIVKISKLNINKPIQEVEIQDKQNKNNIYNKQYKNNSITKANELNKIEESPKISNCINTKFNERKNNNPDFKNSKPNKNVEIKNTQAETLKISDKNKALNKNNTMIYNKPQDNEKTLIHEAKIHKPSENLKSLDDLKKDANVYEECLEGQKSKNKETELILRDLLGKIQKTETKFNINFLEKLKFELGRTADVSQTKDVSWESFGLSKLILKSLEYNEFAYPSPVQADAIPLCLEGKDLIVRSKNGTGKTMTYVIPILEKLCRLRAIIVNNEKEDEAINNDRKNHRRSLSINFALIIVPTRELAMQVGKVFRKIGYYLKEDIMSTFGGSPYHDDIIRIENGVNVIVGTPGRVLDLVRKGIIKPDEFRVLVLDEADKVLAREMREDLEYLVTIYNKNRIIRIEDESTAKIKKQILLFSATFPVEISYFVKEFMVNAEQRNLMPELYLKGVGLYYIRVECQNKLHCLRTLLKKIYINKAIIFCNSIISAEKLGQRVVEMGFPCYFFHSEMEQVERKTIFHKFTNKNNDIKILIGTDLITRGIDVPEVNVVINFDFPRSTESFLHRIGRTGRFGSTGVGLNLVDDDEVDKMVSTEKQLGMEIKGVTDENFKAYLKENN